MILGVFSKYGDTAYVKTLSSYFGHKNGLSGVTDISTLTNIQNTESSAAFTQDGEKLVWDTTDTDVYYKGDTDRLINIR